jgi:hypothetical protein
MILLLLSLLPFSFAENATFTHHLLSEKRSQIVFSEYSSEQKEKLLSTTKSIFYNFNVNEDVKNLNFGSGPIVADMFDRVESNTSVTTHELMTTLSKIFLMQYDDHMNFGFPTPYSCYQSELSFFVKSADVNGVPQVFVNTKYNYTLEDPVRNQALQEAVNRISIGDHIVKYNGKSVAQMIKEYQDEKLVPNNEFFRFSNAIRLLAYRFNRYTPIPNEDEARIVFAKPSGEQYEVTLPWLVTKPDPACVSATDKLNEEEYRTDLGFTEKASSEDLASGIEYVEEYNSSLAYGWGYIQRDGKKYGYFRLGSFTPQVKIGATTTNDLRLVLNHFKNIWTTINNDRAVRGLIFDLRDNRGGSLTIANNIPQYFSNRTITSSRFRLENNPVMLAFYRQMAVRPGYEYFRPQLASRGLYGNFSFTTIG